MTLGKYALLVILSLIGLIDTFLCFGNPAWFNAFVGMLIAATLPFLGAIIGVMK